MSKRTGFLRTDEVHMTGNKVIDGFQMWHGAHRWDPPFELRAPKKGNAEHGAGLYLCCHRQTAQKYAKGGGSLVHVVVDPATRWLETINVPVEVLVEGARQIPRLRKRDLIIEDIERSGRRRDGLLGLNTIVNLAVNHDVMIGEPAVAITEFVASQGADASLYERAGGDDWVVVYNPKILRKAQVIPAREADQYPYDFDPVKVQIERLRAASTAIAQAQDVYDEMSDIIGSARLEPHRRAKP